MEIVKQRLDEKEISDTLLRIYESVEIKGNPINFHRLEGYIVHYLGKINNSPR